MRQSKLVIHTLRDIPKDEESINSKILLRAGYIHKEMSGVYSFLPIGLRALNKVRGIIRKEMNDIYGIELNMSALQSPDLWKKTNRWDLGVWLKTTLTKEKKEAGLGWTHEEAITNMLKHHISSYKQLPVLFYQLQTKFRNEERAKSGLLRTREFEMKDMYSFCVDDKQHDEAYNKIADAYERIFDKVDLGAITYKTFASGGDFAQFSHEYQTISDTGEDFIYIDKGKKIAINKEVYNDETLDKLGVKKEDLEESKSIEVGNIFSLKTKFSDPIGLKFKDKDGKEQPVIMGSYGIGPARLLATVVETHTKEDNLILPESVSPFDYHLLLISNDDDVKEYAEKVFEYLKERGKEVLFDDRDSVQAGEKFKDADLIGIPNRLIVSKKSIEDGGVEYEDRIKEKKEIKKKEDIC